jgi:hypothetical protein
LNMITEIFNHIDKAMLINVFESSKNGYGEW